MESVVSVHLRSPFLVVQKTVLRETRGGGEIQSRVSYTNTTVLSTTIKNIPSVVLKASANIEYRPEFYY